MAVHVTVKLHSTAEGLFDDIPKVAAVKVCLLTLSHVTAISGSPCSIVGCFQVICCSEQTDMIT